MTDKTEEQAAKERAHVAAMKNAQASMTAVLSRCDKLERALARARDNLTGCKRWVAAEAYVYKADNSPQRTVHSHIDAMVKEAQEALG